MQGLVEHLIHRRNFWRRIKLSELSEIYISLTLKSMALSLIAIFIPVYLYKLGFSISQIALFYASYHGFRIGLTYLAGLLVAKYGPKHVISYSYIILIAFLAALLTLDSFHWPLALLALIGSLANSLFFVSLHVDYSKIQDIKSAGKGLSRLFILTRLAAALGPLLGGFIATIWGFQTAIAIAFALLVLAIWPLMQTGEPLRRNGHFNLSEFDWRRYLPSLRAFGAMALERQVVLIIWPLFLGVYVFVKDTYAFVGFVSTVSVSVSILAAHWFGKIVDGRKSRSLLRGSVLLTAVNHLLRQFMRNLGAVTLINISSDLSATGVLMPVTKGIYMEADTAKNRVVYVTVMEMFISLVRLPFWLLVFIMSAAFDPESALVFSFILASLVSLVTLTEKFQALR